MKIPTCDNSNDIMTIIKKFKDQYFFKSQILNFFINRSK